MRNVYLLFVMTFALAPHALANSPQGNQVFQKLNAGQPQTVLIYGTSLSAGGAWAKATREWFDHKFPGLVTFQNSASGGKNSDWGLQNLPVKVLSHKPDLVFIEFSYNDAVDDLMPVERGYDNLQKMVAAIRSQNPRSAIILQIMNVGWDPRPDHLPFSRRANLEKFNENYRRFATKNALPLIDHYPAWLKLKEQNPETFHKYLPDGSHPTPQASLAVTWPAIESFLNHANAQATK